MNKKTISKNLNLPLKKLIFFTLGLNVGIIILIMLLQSFLPPQIPLFYGLPKGEQQLAPPLNLIFPNSISLFLTIINIFFAFLTKSDFFKKILIVSSFTISILGAITTIKIFLLVGSFNV